jgi:hypothetical protein
VVQRNGGRAQEEGNRRSGRIHDCAAADPVATPKGRRR